MKVSEFIKNGANEDNCFGYEDFRAEAIFEKGGEEAEKLADDGKMLHGKLVEFIEKSKINPDYVFFCFEVGNVIRIVNGSYLEIRMVINKEQDNMFDNVRIEIGSVNGGLVMEYDNISYNNSRDFNMIFSVVKASFE